MWGTVCYVNEWDTKDAEVVCRMLGYPGVKQHKTTNFTPVKGISWLDGLQCTGKETSIANCNRTYAWGSGCYHKYDVGVSCKMGKLCVQ